MSRVLWLYMSFEMPWSHIKITKYDFVKQEMPCNDMCSTFLLSCDKNHVRCKLHSFTMQDFFSWITFFITIHWWLSTLLPEKWTMLHSACDFLPSLLSLSLLKYLLSQLLCSFSQLFFATKFFFKKMYMFNFFEEEQFTAITFKSMRWQPKTWTEKLQS